MQIYITFLNAKTSKKHCNSLGSMTFYSHFYPLNREKTHYIYNILMRANNQELTKCLQSELCTTKKGFIPPEYVFTYDSESINWKDSMIGWTVLYRMALEIDYDNKSTVMNALNKIAKIDIGKIKYHRWDGKSKSYKHFTGK